MYALSLEPHASILIEGDAGFTSPLSGVRRGSGTADDPYVISGWFVAEQALGAGIRLVDTRAHVVVENVLLQGLTGHGSVGCRLDATASCSTRGIDLQRAENVTVRNSWITRQMFGIRAVDSAELHVDGVRFGDTALRHPLVASLGYGAWLTGTRNATLSGVHVEDTATLLIVESSVGVRLEGSIVVGGNSRIVYRGPSEISLIGNDLRGVHIVPDAAAARVALIDNEFRGGSFAIGGWDMPSARHDRFLVCGNVFEEMGVARLNGVANFSLVANRVREAGNPLELVFARGVSLVGNEFTGSRTDGIRLELDVDTGTLRGNSFVENAGNHHLVYGEFAAAHNWWGHASGPSGDGPGSGDSLRLPGPTPSADDPRFAPWLTAAPVLPEACPADVRASEGL